MHSLRLRSHLVLLLPESPLSQVSDQRPREVAARSSARAAAGRLPSSGLHPSPWPAACLRTVFLRDWIVHAKSPFCGPEHVLQYVARYTHRVAISNRRLLSVDEDNVSFRWKDYAHHSKQRAMSLTHEEFLRRFLQHV